MHLRLLKTKKNRNKPTAKYCSVCAFILDEKLRAELELEEPRVAKGI